MFVFLAILLLGILITVHEFGHFMAARLTGIAVKEFSIGFGPKLWQWKSKKHDTVFTLRPIPMGGYCMFYGDTDDDPSGEKIDDPRNYPSQPVWKRMLSVFCGPLMNLVLAFTVAVVVMAAYGQAPTQPYVDEIIAGTPAEAAGLMPGDLFVAVDGQDVREKTTGDVVALVKASQGTPIPITVEREGQTMTFQVTPLLNQEQNAYLIGVTVRSDGRPLSIGEILPFAWDQCVYASGAILNALGKLVSTGEGFDDTAGLVGIVQMVASETRQGGLTVFLQLMVMISINLGLVNLIPIPGLDGSRLVFMLLEALRRKPVSQRVEATIHMCGFVLLFGLMIFFIFRDVGRIIGI